MSGAGRRGSERGPKVPYRQVSGAKGPAPTGTMSAEARGGATRGGGPKVPYRQVPGAKTSAPAAPAGDSGRRTPGFEGTGTKVTVTVDDAHLGDVEALAERLRAEGLEVDQVLGDVGIITGSVPADRRSSIGALEGVASVEEETTFQLPSPEAGIQ